MRVWIALAATLVFLGCGGDGSPPAGDDPGDRWRTLSHVDGSLLFTCSEDPFSGDVYMKEETGSVRRLTQLPRGAGATRAAWMNDDVVFVSRRDDIAAIQRLRDLSTVAEGTYPAASDAGKLAYVRVAEGENGRLYDQVVRLVGDRQSAVGRFEVVWGLHWVGERLVAVVGEGAGRRAALVTGSTRVRLPGRRFGVAAISGTGRVAYSYGGLRRPRLAIGSVGGGRYHVFRRHWTPLAWSPDSRRLLVETVERRPRLRIFAPDPGSVTRIGRPPCGYLTSAVWRQFD